MESASVRGCSQSTGTARCLSPVARMARSVFGRLEENDAYWLLNWYIAPSLLTSINAFCLSLV